MPSARPLVALLFVASLAGCLGADALLSPAPSVSVENRSDVSYAVTATVVHTDDPVGTLLLQFDYRDGRTSAVPYYDHAVGNDFAVPANVTGVTVVGAERSWKTVLDPGATAETRLTDWTDGDVVVLTWTRLDDGTVTKVTTVPCRSAGVEYSGHVDSASGTGGASTSC
ncbi:hypothetical protein SAMN04487948_101587 [Halogranum amylolyticum]|uniref:Lipoprotein n=1 Tax=Halogranum amylolyticum TaxID=660520 RepID=A0A1H8NIX2_9EURY|nr:hypothetical protein [Halogranum amylolyticum]SEO29547.1 hypothetical protein SAMN04487948_101587 [Halogranum amylolyticum]